MKEIFLIFLLLFFVPDCFAIPAFPGAEGGGANAMGGRGGIVYQVTNLNNSGSGSLRAACEASGARTVVFTTGGTINLTSAIIISNPYITIAGQTAPGGGILISGANISSSDNGPFILETHDIIMQYLRIRIDGSYDTNRGDGIYIRGNEGANVTNIIVDHCSLSWNMDECGSVWSQGAHIKNITFSWNIIAEGLVSRGKGMLIGSHVSAARNNMKQIDIHHNFFISNADRNPYVGVADQTVINNLIYNWGTGAGVMCRGGVLLDIIGNIVKQGPGSDDSDYRYYPYGSSSCGVTCISGNASIYMHGNIGYQHTDPDADNWHMITGTGEQAVPDSHKKATTLATSNPRTHQVTVHHINNDSLESLILNGAGAYQRLDEDGYWVANRDSVDARLIQEYNAGTGQFPANADAVGGFPTIATGTPYIDVDQDGMPAAWEIRMGLNDSNASDRNGDLDGDGFTNLEEFLAGQKSLFVIVQEIITEIITEITFGVGQ